MRTHILTRRPKSPKEVKDRLRLEGVRAGFLRFLDIGGSAAPAIGTAIGHPLPSSGGLVHQMEVSYTIIY